MRMLSALILTAAAGLGSAGDSTAAKAKPAKLDVLYSQKEPLDIKHPDYDCVYRPAKPAIDKSRYGAQYQLRKQRELGRYKQPDKVKAPRVLDETVILGKALLRFKHFSCAETWMIARVGLPEAAHGPVNKRLKKGADLLGQVALTGSASAKQVRAIRKALILLSKADLTQVTEECDVEKEEGCFTICLRRHHEECRADVSVGFNINDLVASYVERP